MDWSRYRDANPVLISPLDDDLATVPSGMVVDRNISLYIRVNNENKCSIDDLDRETSSVRNYL